MSATPTRDEVLASATVLAIGVTALLAILYYVAAFWAIARMTSSVSSLWLATVLLVPLPTCGFVAFLILRRVAPPFGLNVAVVGLASIASPLAAAWLVQYLGTVLMVAIQGE